MLSIFLVVFLNTIVSCEKLAFVHVVFRHGDRTPCSYYPNDPYNKRSEWPVGKGQLTSIGKMQHFKLGQWLRSRYGNGKLISDVYNENEIHVKSTDVDRTLMSAQANMAGLFPPSGYMQWNPDLVWQPIPIHTKPQSQDYLLSVEHTACPRLTKLRKDARNSDEIQSVFKDNKELLDYISSHSGSKVNSVEEADWLYDNLLVEKLYNKTLPSWTQKVFPGGEFEKIRNLIFTVDSLTHEMKRLQAGPLLQIMKEDWIEAINGSFAKKMEIFSGHDNTISYILNSLNIFDGKPPNYASAVIFELHQLPSSQFGVKILYHKQLDEEPEVLKLPGCEAVCQLEKWIQLTSSVTPDMESWNKECNLGINAITFLQFDIIFLVLTSVFVLFIILRKFRRRVENDYTSI